MAELILNQLAVQAGALTLLKPASAVIAPGEFVAVVGANGAGKSTLLRAAAGLLPGSGTVLHGEVSLTGLPPDRRARHLAYLPQAHDFAWAMSVRATVALGRYAFGSGDAAGDGAVDAALALCGIDALADRPVDRLSGGERALSALARVLATEAPLLLLDEPVAALDVGRQYAMLERLAELAAGGTTILAVFHDLTLAAQFAGRILWIDQAELVADTAADQAAIAGHAPKLLGRAPHWTAGPQDKPLPYFSR